MTPDEMAKRFERVKLIPRDAMMHRLMATACVRTDALAAILAIPADAPDAAQRMRELAQAALGEE